MMFVGFVTAFGLVFNDVEDSELDGLARKHRNSVAAGELSRKGGLIIALTFLTLSLLMIPLLNLYNQILGLIIIFLFYSYSSGIRAKSKPVLDVLYHGLCPAIFAIIGYISQAPFDVSCLIFSTMIFFLSGVSEILQEIRDWESDRKTIETTVTKLGRKSSLFLCLVFLSAVFVLFTSASLNGILPFEYLILSPLTYFVISPIVKTIGKIEYLDEMLRRINNRAPVLIIIFIVAYFLLRSK